MGQQRGDQVPGSEGTLPPSLSPELQEVLDAVTHGRVTWKPRGNRQTFLIDEFHKVTSAGAVLERAGLIRRMPGSTVVLVGALHEPDARCESCGAPGDVRLPDGSTWCHPCDQQADRLGYARWSPTTETP